MFDGGEFSVTLTDYRWSRPDVENLNRVASFGAGSTNFANDFVGHFTLDVRGPAAVIPEPSSVALFGVGLTVLVGFGRKRWRQPKS